MDDWGVAAFMETPWNPILIHIGESMLIIITGKIKAGYNLGVRPHSEKIHLEPPSSHKDVDAAMFSQNFSNLGVSQLVNQLIALLQTPALACSFFSLSALSSGP